MSAFDGLGAYDVPLLTGASGAALVFRSRTRLIGVTPSVEQVQSFVRELESNAERSAPAAADALPGELDSPAAGTLVFVIDSQAGEYVLWFRSESALATSTITASRGDWNVPSPWTAADRTLASRVTYAVLLETKRQLGEMVLRVQEQERGRARAFVAIGHELRNSLGILAGWTQILRTNPPGTEQGTRAVDVLDRNVRIQRKLIDDLVEASKHGLGNVALDAHDVELFRLLEDMLLACRPALDAKAQRLQVELDSQLGVVRGDTERLGQVFANVLANAVKFTPTGGTIRVWAKRNERLVEIGISDTGIGISSEFLPHVFDAFRQAEQGGRHSSGLGLGLTIAKQLIELHGGQIIAESAGIGTGATFRICLPARAAR